LLTAALKPHELAFEAYESGIVVAPAAMFKAELREIKHDISDLAKNQAEAEALAAIVQAIIDPDSWDNAGGSATLKVEATSLVVTQSPQAHFSLILLCEKLRLARKLPIRSKYAPGVVTLAPRASAAAAALDTPVTMNFVPPTRLGHVAEHLKRTTGLRLLVDWRAIAAAGWTPEAEVKCGVANQPASAFVDRLARRMEITWRVLDARTLQLTTVAALAASPDIEVYPIAAADSAALLARWEQQLGASGVLRYDAASGCLIARLPQPAQRKLIAALAK
jgi:hypothetical protein